MHVVTTADGPVTPVGVEQRVEALRRGRAGRRGRRRAGRHPAGRRGRRPGRPPACPAAPPARRPGPGRRGRAPPPGSTGGGGAASSARCRSTSGTPPRSTAPRSPAGPRGCWPAAGRPAVRVLVTGASGMLGAGVGARRCADARRRRHGAAAAPGRAGLPRGARRRRRPRPPSRGRGRGQDAVVHLAAKVDVVGPWADYAAHQRRRAPGSVVDACRAAGVRPAGARLLAVGGARRAGRWSGAGAGPADPRPRPRALRPDQGDRRAARAGRGRPGPRRAWRSARTWSGGPATPSWSAGSSSGPGPAGCR